MARRAFHSIACLIIWTVFSTLAAHAQTNGQVVNLIAFGDYGYDPAKSSQKAVADAMGRYVASCSEKFDAALCVGDNIYVKLTGTDDPQWLTLFETMYDRNRLDFPFYACLGNHDYEHGKAPMELRYGLENPTSRWKMPGRWFRVTLAGEKQFVRILAVDSNIPNLPPEDWTRQRDWLSNQLAGAKDAAFTIVFAHHPLFSNGQHGDNGKLQSQWLDVIEGNNVSIYLAGHDHDMQHLQIAGKKTTYVVAGGGGAPTRDMTRDDRGPFSKRMFGFVHFRITPSQVNAKYIGIDGKIAHEFVREKDGQVKVIQSIGSDKAVKKTEKSDKPRDAD